MRIATVRSTLALLVVGVFMIITAVMALYPLFTQASVDFAMYADFFAKTSSVYTGIVGVVIGYYFGRSVENATVAQQQRQQTEGQKNPG
jgi:membrane protein YqaA with SNARE-associated domain